MCSSRSFHKFPLRSTHCNPWIETISLAASTETILTSPVGCADTSVACASRGPKGVFPEAEYPLRCCMDNVIDQFHDWRLANLKVRIGLVEVSATPPSENRVFEMNDRHGPKHLSGEAPKIAVTKLVHGTLQINVSGSGARRKWQAT
ncbi:hypothetical protein BDW66DRAFT_150315 [Aspergillus desertorum]